MRLFITTNNLINNYQHETGIHKMSFIARSAEIGRALMLIIVIEME